MHAMQASAPAQLGSRADAGRRPLLRATDRSICRKRSAGLCQAGKKQQGSGPGGGGKKQGSQQGTGKQAAGGKPGGSNALRAEIAAALQQQGGGDKEGDSDDDDGFVLDDEDLGGEFDEAGEDGAAAAEYDAEEEEEQEEFSGPGVSTGSTAWGETALRVVERIMASPPMEGLEVYSLVARPANKFLEVRLDRLDDMYGSPSLEDIESFSRMLAAGLEAEMGLEAAGEIAMEVSSPGAERQLRLPADLQRFAELPLRVEYWGEAPVATTSGGGGGGGSGKEKGKGRGADGGTAEAGAAAGASGAAPAAAAAVAAPAKTLQVAVLQMVSFDEAGGLTEWQLADVRANAPGKGRSMSKKQRERRISILLADLKTVRVHVDF